MSAKSLLSLFLAVLCVSVQLPLMQAQTFYPGGLPQPGMWINASNVSTSGADVTGMTDQTSNGASAVEVSATTRPSLDATAFGTLPGVKFTGADQDQLTIANNTVLNTDGNGYSQKNITIVFKTGSALLGMGKQMVYEQGNHNIGLNIYLDNEDLYAGLWESGCMTRFVSVAGLATSTSYIVSFNYNQTNSTLILYLNGIQVDIETPIAIIPSGPCIGAYPTGFDSLPAHTGNITIGACRQTLYSGGSSVSTTAAQDFFTGWIGEIVSYNSGSDAMRLILENSLALKYGINLGAADFYNGGVTNKLVGVGRFSSSDVVSSTSAESDGLSLANGGFLSSTSGNYAFAAHNGLSGIASVGTSYITNREWTLDLMENNNTVVASSDMLKVCFDLDELGLVNPPTIPLSAPGKYFLTTGGAAIAGYVATIEVVSSSSRRACFNVEAVIVDGFPIGVGVDDPVEVVESAANGNCGNSLDDDYDGKTDMIDPGCLLAFENGIYCDNGLDDDGDGVFDCFDPGCNNAGNCLFYYGNPNDDCQYIPNTAPVFTMTETRSSMTNHPIDQRNTVVVGDVNRDGMPDAVSKRPNTNDGVWTDLFTAVPGYVAGRGRIQVFNGNNLSHQVSIQEDNATDYYSQVCIGDVDPVAGNGAEIFVVENDNYLYCYRTNGVTGTLCTTCKVWRSSQPVQARAMSPQLCDFNQDGKAEVYVGNYIFDATFGTRLVAGSTALSMGKNTGTYDSWPIAYDIFETTPGLELVAGNRVYGVNLGDGSQDGGSLTQLAAAPAGLNDGYTSIADMDRDGDVDIVVMAAGRVYIWDPSTQLQLATTYTISGTGSRPNIGDFDGDGYPEIGVAGQNNYAAINWDNGIRSHGNTLAALWTATTDPDGTFGGWLAVDDGSAMSGNTLFDFEGDGSTEVIYSDEENIYVWRTETCLSPGTYPCSALGYRFTPIFAQTSRSGTRTDYPLVVDIDADDQPEIVLTGQTTNGPSATTLGYVAKFDCSNIPFVQTRRIWNQNGFFNTNINDDLSIPRVQQKHHVASLLDKRSLTTPKQHYMNGFLSQTTTLDTTGHPIYPSADAAFHNFNPATDVNFGDCNPNGNVTITIILKNNGNVNIGSGMPISVFKNDPYNLGSSPAFVTKVTTGSTILPGATFTQNITFNVLPNTANYNFTVVVNDNGTGSFPYGQPTNLDSLHTGINDCRRYNNIYKGVINACVLLPVSLSTFTATSLPEKVALDWTTDQEHDALYFVVERSTDNMTFSAMGQVAAKGSSDIRTERYQFNDMAPVQGVAWYRLRIVDANGETGFSDIREVSRVTAAGEMIYVYPNPTTPTADLTIAGIDGFGLESVILYNQIGQEILSDRSGQYRQSASAAVSLQHIAPGLYLVRLDGQTNTVWKTLLIQ